MQLESIEKPHLHIFVGSTSEFDQYVFRLRYEVAERCAVRVLRGTRMQDWSSFFSEIAAALQFPLHFGNNWAALDECLADLEWIPAQGYLLALSDAESILGSTGAADDQLAFFQLLSRISDEWATGGAPGATRQRGAIPFHVLLHTPSPDAADSLKVRLPEGAGRVAHT